MVDSTEHIVVPDEPKKEIVPDTLQRLLTTRIDDSVHAWGSFVEKNKPQLMHYGESSKIVKISSEDWGNGENWFVLGDIHGDFYALSNCLQYVASNFPDFRLVFLGDLVDRGHHPMECLWLLLAFAKNHPNRILWLAGNHDVGVFEQSDKSFASTVSPSEFVDHLNKVDQWTPFRREFGREYIELAKDLPRAALSPDGVLFTHGGVPHVDLQKELISKATVEEKLAWLNSPESLQDFTWTRITRYPRKIPNRVSTGCSYGHSDFAAFCDATKDFFPVSRLVTGHEHPDGGFDPHPEWQIHPALTLKGFGFSNNYEDPKAFYEFYQEHLIIGRCRSNQIPEIITIGVDRDDLLRFFKAEIEPLHPLQVLNAVD